jgi:bifunctional non-homologous end joining protein LigD
MNLILPMLATAAAPFDSAEHVFEVKWDGVRALAAVASGRWRLWGRQGADYTLRYPELAVLGRLPAGTIVDGELVVGQVGRADFPALMRRHQRARPPEIEAASGGPQPAVSYVLFDLLYAQGRALLQEELVQRRARLQELLRGVNEPRLVYSMGSEGCGRAFFARVVADGHEGVMAKQRASRYVPGRRSTSWRKIKPTLRLPCVLLGYRPRRQGGLRLLVATRQAGVLCYVGHVAVGRTALQTAALAQRLAAWPRRRPLVPCPVPACWVEPEFYCQVACQGWTPHGQLRQARWAGWLEEPP